MLQENEEDDGKKKKKNWITADDLDYLTLVMIYALLRLAWEKKVLVIGLIKDVAAAELIKSVVPILQSAGKVQLMRGFPTFNSDKMFLQTSSVINAHSTRVPWRTFEFDACFRTIALLSDVEEQGDDRTIKKNKVAGAFKNVISSERRFLKSYIQLWGSESDPTVRSHDKDRLSAINAIVGIIASRIDLITAREVLNQNVSAITEAAQQQRGNHDIEVSNQQPQKFGDVNPDFVGAAS